MAEQWRQAKKIFNEALRLDLDEREVFLAAACSKDDPLRREVESLLSSFDDAESFLEAPAVGEVADVMLTENNRLADGAAFRHYRIISQIGSGGMGEVYLAEDTILKRQVAVKLLNNVSANNPDHLNRFFQEARAASALNHPNILTIYEIGDFEDTSYIATELVKGKTLRETIKSDEIVLNKVLDIVIQLANALAAAHEAGIVHRDIKPENIMLRDDGLVKVLDFGLAKLTQEKSKVADKDASTRMQVNTQAGIIIGTVAYMSPEQARGKRVDARTDVWSLGIVLYEMLTSRQPFRGETSSDVMAAILKTQPAPLAKLNNEIPDELVRIVSKTLEKNRDERYQSVNDLLIDLKHLRKQLEFEAEQTTSPAQGETKIVDSPATRPHALSSAEFIFTEIGRHKRGFLSALAAIGLAATIGFGYWYFTLDPANTKPIESIAVLPLENLSGDASQDYFADGMTDAVITELAKIGSLRIISRTSTMLYKGTPKKISEIARELNVDAIVVGTVLRSGDKVRIATQMFRAATDKNIWSNSYERSLGDVLGLQSEVARGIVSEIKANLTTAERANLSRNQPTNPNALDAYLKGVFYWNQAIYSTGSTQEVKALYLKSFDYFVQAIDIEPNNAQSHAGLAQAYHWLGSLGFTEYYPKSKEAALTAIRLDETNPQAHGALAWVLWHDEWKFEESEREMLRVIELNPNDNRHGYALLLSSLGRHDDAIAAVKLGEPLDPFNIAFKENIGWIYVDARQYKTAEDRFRVLVEANPNDTYPRRGLATAFAYQGRHQEAIAEQLKVVTQQKGNPATNAQLAWFYAMAGQRTEAVKILDEVTKPVNSSTKEVRIARVYGILREKEQALAWLEKAFTAHLQDILSIKKDPSFDTLRDDPRFQDLLRRVGFPY